MNLRRLCEKVLEPVREEFGPVRITSGYRCPQLNDAVKSSPRSQHIKGEAADFEVRNVSNMDVAKWIRDNLEFDQLILEFFDSSDPNAGWVHCSYADENRNEVFTIGAFGTRTGLDGE